MLPGFDSDPYPDQEVKAEEMPLVTEDEGLSRLAATQPVAGAADFSGAQE